MQDQRYLQRYAVDWAQNNKVFGVDSIAQAEFDTGALSHTMIFGLDYYHSGSLFHGLYDRTAPAIDLFKPVYGQRIDYRQPYRWDRTLSQTGLYVQDQIKWDKWALVLGGRYDWASVVNKEPMQGTRFASKDEAFTGRAGLVYLFDNGMAPFVSYSESFLPLTGTNVDRKPFDPSTGKQYEVGVKYQPPGQKSFVQASVYQLDQENVITTNPNDTFGTQSGAMRSRGVELEAKAVLSDAWDIIASAARNDIKYTKDEEGRQGRHPAGISPLTASMWVNYTVVGDTPLAGLGAGLGVRYARQSLGDYYEGAFSVPSYSVYDASLSYDLSRSPLKLKGVKLALNVQNLTNKTYVSQCTSDLDCYYGEGRTAVSSVTYDW